MPTWLNSCSRTLGAALLLLLMTSCATQQNKKIPTGIYWSPDYNAYLYVSQAVVRRFQYSRSYCFPASAGLLPKVNPNGPQLGQHKWQLEPSGGLTLTRQSDGVQVIFHRVDELPSACGRQTVDTATANLRVLLEILQQVDQLPNKEHVAQLYDKARELDSIVYNSEVSYRLSTFVLLAQALKLTEDPHGFIYDRQLEQIAYGSAVPPERQPQPPLHRYRQQLADRHAAGFSCNDQLWQGPAEPGAHRLVMFSFSGFNNSGYGDAQHSCLKRFLTTTAEQIIAQAPLDTLYINLKYNPGGSLLLASQVLHALVEPSQPIAVLRQQTVDYPSPAHLAGLYQRLVVEVSGETASAAEYLTRELYRQRANTLIVGGPTRGALSSTTVKALPNGVILQLSRPR